MLKSNFLSLVGIVCVLSSPLLAQESKVAASAEKIQALQTGANAPDVSLQNSQGETVKLSSVYSKKPIVLVFFRGGWCPICTKHTQQLIKAYPEIKELGAELIAVSPDSIESSKNNIEKNSIPFPIFSDSQIAATKAFGLAFEVDSKTLEKYKGFGIDLEKASGAKHHALPVPAVYIIDKSGRIAYAHSDPDYRNRLDAKVIIEELKKMK